jgi:NAD(P)-dependent dehydrogenase (short-subunit alcohol dehydrogenase family)
MRFDNKVSVVTGAGQGIGEAYAKALGAEGAHVVVADLNSQGAERVAQQIVHAGGSALAVTVDVSDPASTQAMAKSAIQAFGGIDHLVNNAAIYAGMKLESILTVDLDYYNRFIAVNLNGALHCTRACCDALCDGGGAIVNQSSIAAWTRGGYYSITKAALNSLTMSLAHELGPRGVRVNAIAPGFIDTPATLGVLPQAALDDQTTRTALKRLGHPQDLIGACLYLLSDDASYVTGHILTIDGGLTIRI